MYCYHITIIISLNIIFINIYRLQSADIGDREHVIRASGRFDSNRFMKVSFRGDNYIITGRHPPRYTYVEPFQSWYNIISMSVESNNCLVWTPATLYIHCTHNIKLHLLPRAISAEGSPQKIRYVLCPIFHTPRVPRDR